MDTEELRCLEEGRRIFESGTYGIHVLTEMERVEKYLLTSLKNAKTWREFLETRAQLDMLSKVGEIFSLINIK